MKSANNHATGAVSRKITRAAPRIFLVLLWVYLGLGAVLFAFQAKYIFYPDKTDFENCVSFVDADRISFGSSRGYLTKRSSEKIIVYYHGNAGRACDREYLDTFFARQNFSTYFVEYSGYGEVGNSPSLPKLLKNVEDTVEFLKTRHFQNITVIGESVGVGPAAYHASRSNVDNLILIEAYDSLASVAFSHYPVYPMQLLLFHNFTPEEWLAHYEQPIAIILAENDRIIPTDLGRKLYESIPSNKKTLFIVKGAGHNTIYEEESFYSFLQSAL